MELRLNFTSEEVEQGLEEDFSSAGLFQDAVFRADFEVFDPEEAAPDGLLVLDRCAKGARAGSRYLQSALKTSRPKAHLFGHVHEEYGY